MTDHNAPPDGPDLMAGIASDQLAEGTMLAGRVGEDAVLIARVGGHCYAIGATCSHYGAPLVDGILVGDTIRCPWHHTSFRLRDGGVERPPALDALPCWRVEESAGRLRVVGKATRAETPSAPVAKGSASVPESVVIIGAGAAGMVAAQTLRNEGYSGAITMVDADPDAPVDRPNLSKDYLAGTAEEAWVTLRPPAFFRDNDIALLRPRHAKELDIPGKRVHLDDGTAIPYGALLLATGASPIRLPLPGADRLPLFTLRTLADSRAIIDAATRAGQGARVVVIGASFIGLEVAASLRSRGLEVHVVAPETRPLERVLGPELGDLIHGIHVEHGVVFHLGQKPRELADGAVVLESGERLPAAFVVSGVGVRPNVELAERAGLGVDRGILVDEHLQTNAAGVFAAGDVARYPDARTGEPIRVEHWVAAERQAQVAARNILGAKERFTAVPFFWSAHYDVQISYVGHAERWDAIEVDGSLAERDCEVRYIADGRTLAVATVGRDRANLDAEVAMEREVALRVRTEQVS
jgi:NADPH-dependent 2,4-dienoyl-CoA reductase/sulfur reductase-like enzyme/nitrite reductase/ring-hydroxylating ferredoxin subunit